MNPWFLIGSILSYVLGTEYVPGILNGVALLKLIEP